MLDIKKHSLLGIISLILASIVIIIITINSIIIITCLTIDEYNQSTSTLQEDFLYKQTGIFDFERQTVILIFLTIITTIVGLIARLVKKDRFGTFAFLVGVIGFFLNWILLFNALLIFGF